MMCLCAGDPGQALLQRKGSRHRDDTENEDVVFRTTLLIDVSGTEDRFTIEEFLTYLMHAFIPVVAREIFWPLTLNLRSILPLPLSEWPPIPGGIR